MSGVLRLRNPLSFRLMLLGCAPACCCCCCCCFCCSSSNCSCCWLSRSCWNLRLPLLVSFSSVGSTNSSCERLCRHQKYAAAKRMSRTMMMPRVERTPINIMRPKSAVEWRNGWMKCYAPFGSLNALASRGHLPIKRFPRADMRRAGSAKSISWPERVTRRREGYQVSIDSPITFKLRLSGCADVSVNHICCCESYGWLPPAPTNWPQIIAAHSALLSQIENSNCTNTHTLSTAARDELLNPLLRFLLFFSLSSLFWH